jgi:hypothetical protein
MTIRLIDAVRITGHIDEVEAAYAVEVNWPQGYRLNADARLLLLGASRLIDRLRPTQVHLGDTKENFSTALVMGQNFGSLSSYERFHDTVLAGAAEPLACTLAIPSVPVTAIGIRFGISGPALTIAGGIEVGLLAVRDALMLLSLNRCKRAVAGCWYVPSATSARAGLPDRAQAILLALEGRGNLEAIATVARRMPGWRGSGNPRTCVELLSQWLDANAAMFGAPVDVLAGAEHV